MWLLFVQLRFVSSERAQRSARMAGSAVSRQVLLSIIADHRQYLLRYQFGVEFLVALTRRSPICALLLLADEPERVGESFR